jgi:hypothetical protein
MVDTWPISRELSKITIGSSKISRSTYGIRTNTTARSRHLRSLDDAPSRDD